MTGTAAHQITNYQQLGPGQDLEDAMILGALLREAHDQQDLQAALQAYDETRRPRSQDVGDQGKRLGMLWTGMVDGVGTDAEKLRQALLEWKENSESFDLVEHKNEALKIMGEYKKTEAAVKDASLSGTVSDWVQKALGRFGGEL